MPSTTAPSRASARQPAIFLRRSITSFGHLIWTERPSVRSSASATRDAGDERELRRVPLRGRLQQEREEECRPGRRLPTPAEAAASRRLVIGDDERALGQRGVDEELRRLAGLDVEPGLAELHGFSHTETCLSLSLVKGRRCQSSHRSRSVMPASCAMRSSSDGQT